MDLYTKFLLIIICCAGTGVESQASLESSALSHHLPEMTYLFDPSNSLLSKKVNAETEH